MPIDLPVSPAQSVRVEDLERVKDLIIQKSATTLTVSPAAMRKKIKFQSAVAIPVYQLTLTALTETRDPELKEIVELITEGAANGHTPVPKEEIKLWDEPSRPPASFTSQETLVKIESSMHQTSCSGCGQSGKVICNVCMGSTQIGCPRCKGEGKNFCHFCHGMGHTTCLKCDGRRILRASRTGNPNDVEKCDACHGLGHIACTHCQEGHNTCQSCKGKGTTNCTECKGSMKMTCPTCKGKIQIMSGWGFHASFKPVKSVSNAGVDTVPPSVMAAAFSKAVAAGTFDLPSDGKIEKHINESDLPPAIRNALIKLAGDVSATLSEDTRVVRQQITLAKGVALRVAGQYDGQDFVYYVQEDTKTLHVEKDPFHNLGGSFAGAAKKAMGTKDWANATELARKALSYNNQDAEALQVLSHWKRKIFVEALGASLGAGLATSILAGLLIFLEKGLHKTGPLTTAVGAIMGLSVALGLAGAMLLRLVPRDKRRLAIGFGASMGVLLLFTLVARKAGWLPTVKAADQAALNAEMHKNFAYGVSQVYWEADFKKLKALHEKYKNTQVDLAPIQAAMQKQAALKVQFQKMTEDMNRRAQNVLNSTASTEKKLSDLKILREHFKLRGQDVSFLERNIDSFEKQIEARSKRRVVRHDSRLSIQPVRSSRRLKPLPRVSGRR